MLLKSQVPALYVVSSFSLVQAECALMFHEEANDIVLEIKCYWPISRNLLIYHLQLQI